MNHCSEQSVNNGSLELVQKHRTQFATEKILAQVNFWFYQLLGLVSIYYLPVNIILYCLANAKLVCILSDIKSAVLPYVFLFSYLRDGDIDRHESLHVGRAVSRAELLPLDGDIFRGLQMRGQERERVDFSVSKSHLDSKYLENGKSQCYMSVRA